MGVEDDKLEEFIMGGFVGVRSETQAKESQGRQVDTMGRSSEKVCGRAWRPFLAGCSQGSSQMGGMAGGFQVTPGMKRLEA